MGDNIGSGSVSGTSGVNYSTDMGIPNGGYLSVDDLLQFCAVQLNNYDGLIKQAMDHMNDQNAQANALDKLNGLLDKLPTDGTPASYELKMQIAEAYKEAYDSYPPGSPEQAKLEQQFEAFKKDVCDGHQDTWNATDDDPWDPTGATGGVTLADMGKPPPDTIYPGVPATKGNINVDGVQYYYDPNDTYASELAAHNLPPGYDTSKAAVTADDKTALTTKIGDMSTTAGSGKEIAMIQLQSLVSAREQAIQIATNVQNKMNSGTDAIVANLK